ncbi:MAG: magnesium/cobalt transporter CorA [Alicyclobacillus macrosporangiidus]|uniref:magnesium/cobalt transporter CorA n=1 Tax=Alicyclobacillus TaxID=29330 RepID=UPI0003FAACFD|nr:MULTISPECIES: magnesium/cobalt transporter CorA [Alicyclobacillus]MCL6597866.1 magnesium/cobalt transporter CorA [Alicyclobacillus macrosporangiidus]
MIKTYFYNHQDQRMYHDVDLSRLQDLLADEQSLLWIDLYNCTLDELKWVAAKFDFHPLAIEDCLHDSPRSKVDRYDEYYFFTFHALKYDEESDREVTTEELNVFLAKNYIVTVHRHPVQPIGRIASRSLRDPFHMNKGPDFLLYSIVDGITDEYFPIIERISARIDELEDEMYEHPAMEITEEFLSLKRTIVLIRRVVQPKKRIFQNVGSAYSFAVQEENIPYYMDLTDHLERISDSIEVFRDLVSGALDTYSSLVSAKTNETMRVLTVITTVTATLTLITGYFGMNVPIPFQKRWIATAVVTAGLFVITWIMLRVFRRRKWI